ncbi:MAG: hypothetical protein LBI87_04745 [Candidatus Accumulibacter sp.]|nr:hypothetical protein [Accumulibacter sp.]
MENHRARLMEKPHVESVAELVRLFLERKASTTAGTAKGKEIIRHCLDKRELKARTFPPFPRKRESSSLPPARRAAH